MRTSAVTTHIQGEQKFWRPI